MSLFLVTISGQTCEIILRPTKSRISLHDLSCVRFICFCMHVPRVNKGFGSLGLLERQCFRHHFQNTTSKMSFLDSLIRLTLRYNSVVWGLSLLEPNWASMERVQTLLLYHIIRCHQFTPPNIIFIEFGAHPFKLRAIFDLVRLLCRL